MADQTEPKLPESLEAIRAALPMLPASLLNTIGEYGMARTDRVSELTVQYRWEMLIAEVKDYTAAQLKARDAEIERLRGDAERYQWLRSTTNTFTNDAGERIDVKLHPEQWDAAIDQARATGGEKAK